MQQNKRNSDEALAILQRLVWWGRVIDSLATCPVEELQCVAGRITFFIDIRRCAEQPLPGFATASQQVGDMTPAEKHDAALYLVRLHKARFACAARAAGNHARGASSYVRAMGNKVEFDLSSGFIRKALEVYDD